VAVPVPADVQPVEPRTTVVFCLSRLGETASGSRAACGFAGSWDETINMEAFFTNPLTMAAGGALVSAPIIIHLINRMRFRRIKWAAMEFLLKAQKRMKRKLIIEQLILLFLRCLLVFLVAMLLGRFKWFTPMEG